MVCRLPQLHLFVRSVRSTQRGAARVSTREGGTCSAIFTSWIKGLYFFYCSTFIINTFKINTYIYILYMNYVLYIFRYPPFSGFIFIYWRVDCFVHLYLEWFACVDEVQDSGGGKRQTNCRWTGLAMFVSEPSCKWVYACVSIWIWFMCIYI